MACQVDEDNFIADTAWNFQPGQCAADAGNYISKIIASLYIPH